MAFGAVAAWFVTLAAKLDGALDVTYVTASIPLFVAFGLTCCFATCVRPLSSMLSSFTCVRVLARDRVFACEMGSSKGPDSAHPSIELIVVFFVGSAHAPDATALLIDWPRR